MNNGKIMKIYNYISNLHYIYEGGKIVEHRWCYYKHCICSNCGVFNKLSLFGFSKEHKCHARNK